MRAGALAVLACSLAAFAAGAPAHGGAWVQREGARYQRLAVQDYAGEGDDGSLSVTYYGEFGLTERRTLVAALPVQARDGAAADRDVALGEAGLSLRQALLTRPLVVSVQGGAFVAEAGNFLTAGPTGPGAALEGRLLVGRGFGRAGYLNLEAAHRIGPGTARERRLAAEYGLDLTSRLYARARIDERRVLSRPDGADAPADQTRHAATIGWRASPRVALELTLARRPEGERPLSGVERELALVMRF